MDLISTRRFLTDDEINFVVILCNKFGASFPMYFPEHNITRKIHELLFTVPRFLRKFITVGLLGEQTSESKHASVNAELRSFASVRNHSEKMQLVLQREELRYSMNKSLI